MISLPSAPVPQEPKRANASHRPWQLLAGSCERRFEMEPELRLFQIKYWLTGRKIRLEAFREAALIFGACYTHYIMGGLHAPDSMRRVKDPFHSRDHRIAFRHCFKRGNLADLRITPGVKESALQRAATQKTDRYWIELARARLQLIVQSGDSRKESAVQLLQEHKISGTVGATTAEKNKSAEPKSSFLLAADLSLKSLLIYPYTGKSLIRDLKAEIPDAETFRNYCRLVRAIDQKLCIGGDEFIESTVGVSACSLPDLPLLPPDFVTATGHGPALETKLAARQQPQRQ